MLISMKRQVLRAFVGSWILALVQLGCSKPNSAEPGQPVQSDPYVSRAPVVRGLQMIGRVQSVSNAYRARVTITNPTSQRTEFGLVRFECGVTLRLSSSSGELLWDQARDTPRRDGGCKWLPSEVALAPGDSVVVQTEEVPLSLLRSSLGSGVYRAEIELIFARMVPHKKIAGALTTMVDTIARVRAGTLDLK